MIRVEDCPSPTPHQCLCTGLLRRRQPPCYMGKHPGTRRNAMPSGIDTTEREIAYVETHDLPLKTPQTRRARPGFWHTLAHVITKHLTPTPRERHVLSRSAYD